MQTISQQQLLILCDTRHGEKYVNITLLQSPT